MIGRRGPIGLVVLALVGSALAVGQHQEHPPVVADAAGHLHVPGDYRQHHEFLGSWSIAAEKAPGAQQIHAVYVSPGGVSAYRATGRFPEGTVLIKEVHAATTAAMTTGTVSRAGQLKGWFVMVKDARAGHPDNPLWGDGWGWSWFDADKPTYTTSTEYRKDCLGCHVPAKATDRVYVQGYPSLSR